MIDKLVEVHSHILPGIDDGSPDVDTSLKMIGMLKKQGASAIVLTPHYYSDSISYEDFVKRRDDSFELLKLLFLLTAQSLYLRQRFILQNIFCAIQILTKLRLAIPIMHLLNILFPAIFHGIYMNVCSI